MLSPSKIIFWGVFPCFQKKSRNQGVLGELRQTSRNANNVLRHPPPQSPSASDDSPCIYSLVANQAMQSHGGNNSTCDCIARFLPWGDFHVKIVLTTHARGHDTFLSVAARKWPSPRPNLVNTPPPRTRPFSQHSSKAGDACVVGVGIAGGCRPR